MTKLLCKSAVRTAELDLECLAAAELAECLSLIVDAGRRSDPEAFKHIQENNDLLRSLAFVIVPVVEKTWMRLRRSASLWRQQWAKFNSPFKSLVKLICAASRLGEDVFVTRNRKPYDKTEELVELRKQMMQSAAVEEVILQFIVHANSRSRTLVLEAMSSFSRIFSFGPAPLEKVPSGLETLGAVLRDILREAENEDSENEDWTGYPSTYATPFEFD
ncbi:hypothetical protein FRB90_001782 [Tulasnella sp. 427]|nr:hypothetical protein FRB90_001782 [Tulasnella sp. 427]